MKVVRLVTLAVLAAVLAVALLIAQAAVSARLTLLNPTYMLNEAHRQGVMAVVYGGAAAFVADPESNLSASDQTAAGLALQALIDNAALESLATVAIARLEGFWTGQSESVTLEIDALKNQLVAEMARAGGSAEALERLRSALAQVPDTVLIVDRTVLDVAPIDLWALLHLSLILLGVIGAFSLIGMVALAGDFPSVLAWVGATFAAAGGAGLAATMRLHSLVVGSASLLPGLTQLQLPAQTQLELEAALSALLRQLAAQLRLVPAVVLALGAVALVAGVWMTARAHQVEGGMARRAATGS